VLRLVLVVVPAGLLAPNPAAWTFCQQLWGVSRRGNGTQQSNTFRQEDHNVFDQALSVQAERAYEAARKSPSADWRALAELFRAAVRARPNRTAKSTKAKHPEIADYNVDRIKLKCRSPRIAVRFMDGEAVFTHAPSAPGKPLNVGRALRVAIAMYRSRRTVQQRNGFHEYDRAMSVPEIFQVRCLETDELFDPAACSAHTAGGACEQ
jgi:hypothetical protein